MQFKYYCALCKGNPSYHACPLGAIDVSIATMLKKDHCSVNEVYVCGFVPSYLLPKKRPNSIDPFLHPLIEEVEDMFINGKIIR